MSFLSLYSGINLGMAKAMLGWLVTLPSVTIPADLSNDLMKKLSKTLISRQDHDIVVDAPTTRGSNDKVAIVTGSFGNKNARAMKMTAVAANATVDHRICTKFQWKS